MMREEDEGGAPGSPNKGGDDIPMDDNDSELGTPSKGKHPGADEISIEKLKIRFLAMAEYLKQELSTMDAEKAKQWGFLAKEKAVLMALAFKALMMEYVNELKQMDKEKARELGLKYQGKAKELGQKYTAKTAEVAGVARRHAMQVASELKTLDKQKSIDMVRKGKVVVKEMSPAAKIKYGILFALLFFMMGSGRGPRQIKHPHLCYFEDSKFEPSQKAAKCEAMLAPVTSGKTNWIFIGNQPIFALFKKFNEYQSGSDSDADTKPFKQVRGDAGKKRKVQFFYQYELPDPGPWKEKYGNYRASPEIVTKNGIGQADCGNCPMQKLVGKKKDMVLEVLLAEASRDVSQVTTTTSTTQETIARYLSENYPDKSKTVCVVQQGSYELHKAPEKTTQQYVDHSKDFHDKLEQHCGVLIRIGQFRDHGDLKVKIDEWNEALRDLVLTNSRNGYFIDISQVSNPTVDTYSEPMWGMFSRLSKALE